jgi:protein dithiol oxidoreductase (disulfide-forming)
MNKNPRSLARTLLAAGILLLAARGAAAQDLKEGVQYKLLKPPVPSELAPGKVEVVEAFWYACGHCYVLEPKLEAWNTKGRPAYVQLVRLPATWNEITKNHARLFYTIEILGKPQLHAEAFREINVKGNRLDTPEKIEAFFVSKGVSAPEFQKTFSSFAVESKLRKAEEMNKRYRITGTPTLVVAGKYVTDVGMAGGEDELFRIVNALAAREKGGG